MNDEPKILEDGESTFRNGGSMCGGVINRSRWEKGLKEDGGYGLLMAFVMDDDKFEIYKKLKASKGKSDQKSAQEWFKKYARSNI